MFVLRNLLIAIANVLDIVLDIYIWILIINAILSWIKVNPYSELVMTIDRIAGFILNPIRRRLPLVIGYIDFTPIVVIIIISFMRSFVVRTLIDIASNL